MAPLITVHPPTKLCQSRATPEPQNKYILNDAGTTPEGKKRYLPGMISERYGMYTVYIYRYGMYIYTYRYGMYVYIYIHIQVHEYYCYCLGAPPAG